MGDPVPALIPLDQLLLFPSIKEVNMMREPQWRAVVLAVMMASLLLPLGAVSANETTEERLAAEGLSLLALRNDTIDTDQDGDIDAVRWLWS